MTFHLQFFISNIFISILLCILLFTKRFCKKHMTLNVQYRLWYIFTFVLLLPFIPYQLFRPGRFFLFIRHFFVQNTVNSGHILAQNEAVSALSSDLRIQDFSAAVSLQNRIWSNLLLYVWIAGMVLTALFFTYTMLKIYRLRKHAYLITAKKEPDLYRIYQSCLNELNIQKQVRLYASCTLSSPVSYGFILPKIIIPQDLDILLSENEIRFVFLHELQHYKHRDSILNNMVCLLQILYWFNPLIWYAFHQLRKDREIACDHSVLRVIGKEECMNYGYTILRYAENMQNKMFLSPLSSIGGNKNTIRQRIVEIAEYQKDSVFRKLKSTGILFLALLVAYCSSPLFMVNASSSTSLETEKWKEFDASSYFGNAEGSFVLYDRNSGQYQVYNKELSEKQVSPESTFKIYSALFALEDNIISPNDSYQKWDGTEQPFDTWAQDQTLDTAMQNSVNWYFQNLDHELGLPVLYSYYNKISYGNGNLSGGVDSYWSNSLKISPFEQVQLLSDLLQNKWGFRPENIEAVKDSMYIADTAFGKLYGKTGTGNRGGANANGWFIGFLEQEQNTYCFAVNLQQAEDASGSAASDIAVRILGDLFS